MSNQLTATCPYKGNCVQLELINVRLPTADQHREAQQTLGLSIGRSQEEVGRGQSSCRRSGGFQEEAGAPKIGGWEAISRIGSPVDKCGEDQGSTEERTGRHQSPGYSWKSSKFTVWNIEKLFETTISKFTQERLALLSKYRNLEMDLEGARKLIEDDEAIKLNLHNQLSKAHSEINAWKAKFESAGYVLREEMEEMRKKLTLRLQEADDHIEQLNIKTSSLERSKQKLHDEVEELSNELEQTRVLAITFEKKLKSAEKEIMEWKQRCEDLASELDASQKECRNYSTELFKLKAAYEELTEQFESAKRENKNLQDEVKDLLDQLSESSKNIQDLELTRKRLTMEKEELQNALAEAETALEVEENKVYAAQQALEQARIDNERVIREKEEEFEGVRRNMQKALDQMQTSLEHEARGRAEALKQKKKLEGDIVELEMALDAANKAHAEAQNFIHRLQGNLKDLQEALDHETRAKEEAQELYSQSERKCHALHNELDQTRTILELSDRKVRNLENELGDLSEINTELNANNAALSNSKRKIEGEMQILKADFEEALNEAKLLDDKCRKAIVDAARLADELREEQEHAQQEEKLRKSLEEQNKELQVRLDEAEQAAMVAGRKTIAKLESRVRELTQELESEQRKYAESSKNLRKADRRIKELQFEYDEVKKNQENLQEMTDKLSQKVKAYKRQIEEAEEIAALNMAKYRKLQTELEEAEEHADSASSNLAKLRAKTRSSISMNRAQSPVVSSHDVLVTQKKINQFFPLLAASLWITRPVELTQAMDNSV